MSHQIELPTTNGGGREPENGVKLQYPLSAIFHCREQRTVVHRGEQTQTKHRQQPKTQHQRGERHMLILRLEDDRKLKSAGS